LSYQDASTPAFSPDYTLHGMLQRGRGRGFLLALEAPREEVWALLVDCVLNDPRLDTQTERACDFYAELMVATQMPLEPLLSALRSRFEEQRRRDAARDPEVEWPHDQCQRACGILGPLARLGIASAFDLLIEEIARGHHWGDYTMNLLGHGLDAERLDRVEQAIAPRLSSVESIDDEFRRAEYAQPAVRAVFHSWRQRYPALEESFAAEERRSALRKAEGTGSRPNDPPATAEATNELLDALERTAFDPIEVRARTRGPALRSLKRANSEFVLGRARIWFDASCPEMSELGEFLIKWHATEADRPRLISRLESFVAAEPLVATCYDGHSMLQALARLERGGPDENYARILTRAHCPNLPGDAAKAMVANDPDGFRTGFATECLWDANATCRELGILHAELSDARAVPRLGELATSPLFGEKSRASAQARLASIRHT
jgi:hypothetical protein